MTGYKSKATTPYYRDMIAKLREIATTRPAVTQNELAAMLNRKVTKSFRRAVTQAEIDGLITKQKYLTERGGLGVCFELHVDLVQLSLPFEQGHPF